MFFKTTTVPLCNDTKQVQTVQLWEVRWDSRKRDGYMSHGATQEEVEVFTSESDAIAFKESLKKAYALLRQESGTDIRSKKRV
jgi:hypothetical protein